MVNMGSSMILGAFAFIVFLWFLAITYIVKGWGQMKEVPASEAPKSRISEIDIEQAISTPALEEERLEEDIEEEIGEVVAAKPKIALEVEERRESKEEKEQVRREERETQKREEESLKEERERLQIEREKLREEKDRLKREESQRREREKEKLREEEWEKRRIQEEIRKEIQEKIREQLKEREREEAAKKETERETLKASVSEPDLETPQEDTQPSGPVPSTQAEQDDFYRTFGKAHTVEFPAEYIDSHNVRSLSGSEISILEFARNCYREIGFQCLETVMIKEEYDERVYKINIFDLVSDHYSKTEEDFISYFGRLKEEFSNEIESITSHPDISPENKRALVGRYDGLPQLVIWNNTELFLLLVKSKDEILYKREIDFFKEFVIEKRLFKAKIFNVVQKQEKEKETEGAKPQDATVEDAKHAIEGAVQEDRPLEEKLATSEKKNKKSGDKTFNLTKEDFEEAKREVLKPKEEVKKPKKSRRKRFTKEEIEFLKENKGKMTNEQLAEELGRSIDSVTHKLSRLGIARESYEWTDEKDIFLRENISTLSYRQLAERLGTTISSVRARCKKANIKKQ